MLQSDPVSAVPVPDDATDDTMPDASWLYGWSLRESAGTPAVATVLFKDTDASGDILAVLELAANASDTFVFPHPVKVPSGTLYVDKVAGSTEGAVYVSG